MRDHKRPRTKAERLKACAVQRERNARIREEMAAMPYQSDEDVFRKLGALRIAIDQLEQARARVMTACNAEEQAKLSKLIKPFEREVQRRRVDLGMPAHAQEGRTK